MSGYFATIVEFGAGISKKLIKFESTPYGGLATAGGIATGIDNFSSSAYVNGSTGTALVDARTGNKTFQIISTSAMEGAIMIIKKTDATANTITISGDNSATIEGFNAYVLTTPNQSVTLQLHDSNWEVIGSHIPKLIISNAGTPDQIIGTSTSNVSNLAPVLSIAQKPG